MYLYLIYDDDGTIHSVYDNMKDMIYNLVEYYKRGKYYHFKWGIF